MVRHLRFTIQIVTTFFLFLAIALGTRLASIPNARAQDGDQCEQLASQALLEANVFCSELARGEACYGHAGVTVTGQTGTSAGLVASGDRAPLVDLETLSTTAAKEDSGDWGLAVLKLSAGLPEGDQAVTAVLFGGASITRPTQVAQPDRPTLTVINRGGADINLRNGAGITYDVVGQLGAGVEATADGRNEQGDWVRIQYDGGIAWVFTPLIRWEGDQSAINALNVLPPNDVTPPFESGEPFQAFTLVTGDSPCAAAPSGLLLQTNGDQTASLQVNQVTLEFASATLLVTSHSGDTLEVKLLQGSGTVTARGISQTVSTLNGASVPLGGEDGLTPNAAPVALRSYSFPDIAFVPLELLPDPIACTIGLPTTRTDIALRVGPGTQRGELGTMSASASYTAIGWSNDPDGAPWWELDTGTQSSWVPKSVVRAIGDCEAVAQVEPPPLVFAPSAPASGGGDYVPGGVDFAPTANSVWQMRPGSDNMTGQCTGAPAINFCDHLAAITPADGGISWRGMEASPYYLVRIQPNVYSYSGPNILGTGKVMLTLTFTNETTLNMTMNLVLNNEPNCQHMYFYSGTRNW